MSDITSESAFLAKNKDLLASYTPIKLLNITQVTPEAKEFKFEVMEPDPIKFLPGQFMDFIVDTDELLKIFNDTDHLVLSQRKLLGWENPYPMGGFSFISKPNSPIIEFISKGIKIYPHPVQRYLHTRAKVGDIFFVSKTGQGQMYWTKQMENTITCIVGGIGITPVISILRTMDNREKVKLIISAKSLSLIPHLDEIKNSVKDLFITLTGEVTDGSKRLNLTTLKNLNLDTKGHVFICGPYGMTEEMERICQELGFDSQNIHSEKWQREKKLKN
jgi:ferredoxin-NADP reductase